MIVDSINKFPKNHNKLNDRNLLFFAWKTPILKRNNRKNNEIKVEKGSIIDVEMEKSCSRFNLNGCGNNNRLI